MKKQLSYGDKLLSEYKEIASFMNYFKVEPEEATKEIKFGWYKENPFLEKKKLIGYPPRHPYYIGESLMKIDIKWNFLRVFEIFAKISELEGITLGFKNGKVYFKTKEGIIDFENHFKLTETIYEFSLPIVRRIVSESKKKQRK